MPRIFMSQPSTLAPLANETAYEKSQRYNAITRWLHSFRYRSILKVFAELAREIPDRPIRVLELGAATGKLYAVIDERFRIDYTGVELDRTFYEAALERYGTRDNFRIHHRSAADDAVYQGMGSPDIVVAMETCEHIPERDSFRIIEHVAALKPRLFVCSVPVEVGPSLWIKNVGSALMGYKRHLSYRWSDTFWAGLYMLDHVPPHRTGHRGFDWRWLAQSIRHFMRIREIRKNPFQWVPNMFALSVMMIAEPRE
jgi:SAM-dependent methyltransferase